MATVLAEAEKAHPLECCGLLLGEGGIIREARSTANVHPDPARHFEIDPAALIAAHRTARAGGLQLLGYYHSHPTGLTQPSASDAAMAAGDGRVWVIAAAGALRLWRDLPTGFEALPLRVASG